MYRCMYQHVSAVQSMNREEGHGSSRIPMSINLSESTLLYACFFFLLPTAAEPPPPRDGSIFGTETDAYPLASRDHAPAGHGITGSADTYVVLEVDLYHHYMHASFLRYGCFDQDE